MKPRIGIPTPTTNDLDYNEVYWPMYAEAVTLSGGSPIEISLGQGRLSLLSVLKTCSGFILPGSPADVDPARYGQSCQNSAAPDPSRENMDSAILSHAETQRTPVLGICYGMQLINVYYGGTLIQEIAKEPLDHSAGPSVPIAHAVELEPSSDLASIFLPKSSARSGPHRFLANSSHHQAIDVVGTGLRVAAWSTEDRIAEALELDRRDSASKDRLLLAVQWHPERSFQTSPESRALFNVLVKNAAASSRRAAFASAQ